MKKDNEDLLEQIRKNFEVAKIAYEDQRKEALEDFKFRAGDQWPEELKSYREERGLPCLKTNKISEFIRQVVNSQKINRPQINVSPISLDADSDKALVRQALIHQIQRKSNADSIIDTAFDNAVTCGEGYMRIVTDYANPDSFDQEIFLESIDNIFSVYLDPLFKSNFKDINWAFVFEDMTRDDYKKLYPETTLFDTNYFSDTGDTGGWLSDSNVRVAEYFHIDEEKYKIHQLSTGETFTDEELKEFPDDVEYKIIKSRDTFRKVVKYYKTNGYEILEENIFPGEDIPIIPVFADFYTYNGKKIFEGIVRHSKDPQRMYNYLTSAEAQMISFSPKASYMIAEGQTEGYEDQWDNINDPTQSTITYKTKTEGSGGQPLNPPIRIDGAVNTQSIVQSKMSANEDLKNTTGIYDPSMGRDAKEASGKALLTQQRKGEITNFVYADNLAKSLKYLGDILLKIIPVVYDTEREVRVVSQNEDDKFVKINSLDNEEGLVLLSNGDYDTEVSIGPYGETERQQSLDAMFTLMQVNENITPLISDIVAKNLNIQGAKEISDRLKTLLPPELRDGDKAISPEAQAQIQELTNTNAQMEAMLQQMQVINSQMHSELNRVTAQLSNRVNDNISRERQVAMKELGSLEREKMKIMHEENMSHQKMVMDSQEAYFKQKSNTPNVAYPEDLDMYVTPGINDQLTLAQQEEQRLLSEQEIQNNLQNIENQVEYSTKMDRRK